MRMDEGTLTIIYYLIPIIITGSFIFMTMRLSYSKRFLPTFTLGMLALVLFLSGQFMPKNPDNLTFDIALTLIYLSVTFFAGSIVTIVAALFRKKTA